MNDSSDPAAIIQNLKSTAADQSPALSLNEVENTILTLTKNGRELAQIGSQFNADRTLTGEGFEIKIHARFGRKMGFLSRLLGG